MDLFNQTIEDDLAEIKRKKKSLMTVATNNKDNQRQNEIFLFIRFVSQSGQTMKISRNSRKYFRQVYFCFLLCVFVCVWLCVCVCVLCVCRCVRAFVFAIDWGRQYLEMTEEIDIVFSAHEKERMCVCVREREGGEREKERESGRVYWKKRRWNLTT